MQYFHRPITGGTLLFESRREPIICKKHLDLQQILSHSIGHRKNKMAEEARPIVTYNHIFPNCVAKKLKKLSKLIRFYVMEEMRKNRDPASIKPRGEQHYENTQQMDL